MRKQSHWGRVCAGGAVAVIVGAWIGVSGVVFGQSRQPQPNRLDGAVCPLSDEQTRKSIEAFSKLAAFMTHEPRCVNCHGGVNPFIDGVGPEPGRTEIPVSLVEHGGGKQAREFNPVDNVELMAIGCETCHDNTARNARWTTAPPFMTFVGQSSTTLCQRMKRLSGAARDFLHHLTNDALIVTAFTGTRGLNYGMYFTGTDPLTPEPPSITQDAFTQMGQEWIDAMGGEFKGDTDCGCAPHKYQAKIRQHGKGKLATGAVRGEAESEVPLAIDLRFEAEGHFSGQTKVAREAPMQGMAPGVGCEGGTTWVETWSVDGTVDDKTGQMQVRVQVDQSPLQVRILCQTPNGPISRAFTTPGKSSDAARSPIENRFTLPARIGESRHFEWTAGPGRFTADFEFVQVPP